MRQRISPRTTRCRCWARLGEIGAGRAGTAARAQVAGVVACGYRHEPARPDRARAGRAAARTPALLDGIDMRYVMTHLVGAERARRSSQRGAAARVSRRYARQIAGGAAQHRQFLRRFSWARMSRPTWRARGRRSTGSTRTPGQPNPMQPVVRLTRPVLQIREVEAGETRGLQRTWTRARRADRHRRRGLRGRAAPRALQPRAGVF